MSATDAAHADSTDGPRPAEPAPGRVSADKRGRLQRPSTAEGAARHLNRVITFRLDPDRETWLLLRRRASQSAAYRNKHAQAKLGDALGWRVPEGAAKDTLVKLVRATERGDISACVYSGCESEVKKDWTRDGRKCMAGKRLAQYGDNNLPIATISGRAGVEILEDGAGGYVARLNVSARHVEGGCWITVPLHGGAAKKDEHRGQALHEFAHEDKRITAARVLFKIHAGKTLLQITHRVRAPALPAMGERRATLSQLTDGRLVLRVDDARQQQDYTSRVRALERLAANDDGLRRRLQAQIGRRRGHARIKREKIAEAGFTRRRDTLLHQWSRELADWLETQGVGQLTVVGLVGGSWAAHKLMQLLAYKCAERGCKVIEHGEFTDPTVERAVKREAGKKSRRARRNAQAARTIITAKEGDNI